MSKKRPEFNKPIAARPDPKVLGRYHIEDAELLEVKTGPRLNPVKRKIKPGGEQTTWLK